MPAVMKCLPKNKPTFKPAGVHLCNAEDLKRWEHAHWCYPPYHPKQKHLLFENESFVPQMSTKDKS
eukprot:1789966-Karenia_brevis.AAC.1